MSADSERPTPPTPEPEGEAPQETQTAPATDEAGDTEPQGAEASPDEGVRAERESGTGTGTTESAGEAGGEAPSAPAPKKDEGVGKSLALIFATVGVVALLVFLLPRKVDLIVDNGLGLPVRIFVNGKDRGRIEPHDSRVLSSVPAGAVVLTGHEVGPEGQKGRAFEALEGELTAPLFRQRRRAYIWNVEGQTESYWITKHGYGDQADKVFKPEAYVPPGHLFVIPGRCEPLLNDVPKQVTVSGGAKGTTREVLFSSHRIMRIMMEKRAREELGAMPPPMPPKSN